MDETLNKFGKMMGWLTVVVVATATTVLAVWLIQHPQIGQATPWAGVFKHPGFILAAAGVAILPWWVMAVTAMDAQRMRESRRDAALKGPADWLSVMLTDRRSREKRW
jgi:cytosine/uracil/thiamine/allantoin permease